MRINHTVLAMVAVAGLAFAAGHHYTGNQAVAGGEGEKYSKKKGPSQDGVDWEAKMEAYTKIGAPGENHKLMQPLVGEWEAEFTMYGDEGAVVMQSSGTITRKWILGGRFLKEHVTASNDEGSFEGLGFIGYNNYDGQYEMAWLESHSSAIIMETGYFDAEKQTFVWRGGHRDPMSGKIIQGYGKLDISNPDYQVFSSYIIGADGHKKKQFEGVTRRKASAHKTKR